jgi:hypothetical protein
VVSLCSLCKLIKGLLLLHPGKSKLGSALVVIIGQYSVLNLTTHATARIIATWWIRTTFTILSFLSLSKDEWLSNDTDQGYGEQEKYLEVDLDVHVVKAGWRRQ